PPRSKARSASPGCLLSLREAAGRSGSLRCDRPLGSPPWWTRPPEGAAAADERWFLPGVRAIGAASFLSDLGHEVPTALLPSFLANTLDLGTARAAAALGVIEGVADGAGGAARFAGGPLADDPGRRRATAVGGYTTTAILVPVIPGTLAAAAIVIAGRLAPRLAQRGRRPVRLHVRAVLRGRLGRLMFGIVAFELANVAATLLILRTTELIAPGQTYSRTAVLLYAGYNLAATLIAIPGGHLSDRRGATIVLVLASCA